MGYYTEYRLEAKDVRDIDEAKLINDVLFENEEAKYALLDMKFVSLNSIGNTNKCVWYPKTNTKWYDAKEDIFKLANRFPHVTFMLSGVGDERLDVWNCYFKDSIMETCLAILPEPRIVNWNKTNGGTVTYD